MRAMPKALWWNGFSFAGARHGLLALGSSLLGQLCVGLALAAGLSPAAHAAPAVAEGRLEVVVEDHANFSRTRHFLHTANGRVELQVKAAPRHWRAGATLRVKGDLSGPVMLLSTADVNDATVTAAAPLVNTVGEQKIGVLLVNFTDDRSQPFTLAQVHDMVFNQLNGYVRENSFQKTWVSGNSWGWLNLPIAKTCNGLDINIQARQAATNAGIDLSGYGRLVFVFPLDYTCGWSGMANVGGAQPSIWINGWRQLKTFAHELGHSFGLMHAHAQDCGSTAVGGTCTVDEYGDTIDAMGGQAGGHYDAFNKEQLGWLGNVAATPATPTGGQPVVASVSASGRYSLETYSTPAGTLPKALKLPRGVDPATGAMRWYYIEYRQAVGSDAVLANWPATNYLRGLVIRTATQDDSNSGQLLDMSPNSSPDRDWEDAALLFGQSFTDAAAGVTLVAVAGNASGAQVDITLNPPANCTRAAPALALASAQTSVAAGGTKTYTVNLNNRDSAGCGASNFDLNGTPPTGFGASLVTSRLSVAPGASAATSWAVTAPAGTPAGSYGLSLQASNASAGGSAGQTSAQLVVAADLMTAVNTDKGQYLRGDTVVATAVVSSGGAMLVGATVSFVFIKPDGATFTKTALTDVAGRATLRYRLTRKDPVGAWQLQSRVNVGGANAQASGAFTVQ